MYKKITILFSLIVNFAIAQTTVTPVKNGGTSFSTYTIGNILYASGVSTFTRLPIGTSGQLLSVSGGVPTWSTVTGGGTVTSFSFTNGNGFVGNVTNPTTTPTFSLNAPTTFSSLSSIGTVTTGVWNASVIPIIYGGTNNTSTLTTNGIMYFDGTKITNATLFQDNGTTITYGGSAGQVITPGDPGFQYEFHSTGGTRMLMNWDADGSNQINWHCYKYNGTASSPTQTLNNDFLMSWGLRGYNGTAFTQSSSAVQVQATQNWSSGEGSKIIFSTTANNFSATNRRSVLLLDQDGSVQLGIGQKSRFLGTGELVVNGSALIGSEIFSAQASSSRSMTWDGSQFNMVSGTVTDVQSPVILTSATLPATRTQNTFIERNVYTTAGSSSFAIYGGYKQLSAGYTGSSQVTTGAFDNRTAGTGNSLIFATSGGFATGNGAIMGRSIATTTGLNYGVYGEADGGNTSIGVTGNATVDKNSATNIGVLGFGYNAGSSPIQIGGYFGLNNSSPTFASAALLADNGSTSSPVFLARVNGTTKVSITSSGDLQLNVAGNGVYIKEGSNATMGTGTLVAGTLTISNTKVTATSRIFLTDTGGGVLANIGALYLSARNAGTSFTVSSSNILDTSTFEWIIIEPAP